MNLNRELFAGEKQGKREKMVTGEVNKIEVHYMHLWKCHKETDYFVQENKQANKQINKKKKNLQFNKLQMPSMDLLSSPLLPPGRHQATISSL
jgi:hypothetical protein